MTPLLWIFVALVAVLAVVGAAVVVVDLAFVLAGSR